DVRNRQKAQKIDPVAETPQPERAERDARRQEAQHRTEAQPMKDRHNDARRGKEQQRLSIGVKRRGRGHEPALSAPGWSRSIDSTCKSFASRLQAAHLRAGPSR